MNQVDVSTNGRAEGGEPPSKKEKKGENHPSLEGCFFKKFKFALLQHVSFLIRISKR
jgi:hypothetical protein